MDLGSPVGRAPTRSRSDFCRRAGLRDERPFVWWACSALLPGSPPEPTIVLRWARHLRSSNDPRIRDVPILIRPHPSRMADRSLVDWRSVGTIALFGGPPIDSLHFQHLADSEHGLLTMAASLAEHGRQLAHILESPTDVLPRQRQFVHAFLRPRVMEVSATNVVVEALERLGDREAVGSVSRPSLFGRIGLALLARMQRDEGLRYLIFDEREGDRESRLAQRARVRADELARKRADKAQRMAEKRRTSKAPKPPEPV